MPNIAPNTGRRHHRCLAILRRTYLGMLFTQHQPRLPVPEPWRMHVIQLLKCDQLAIVTSEMYQVVDTVFRLDARKDRELGAILSLKRKRGPFPKDKLVTIYRPSVKMQGRQPSSLLVLLLYIRCLLICDYQLDLSKANAALFCLLSNAPLMSSLNSRNRLATRLSNELLRWLPTGQAQPRKKGKSSLVERS